MAYKNDIVCLPMRLVKMNFSFFCHNKATLSIFLCYKMQYDTYQFGDIYHFVYE